MKLRVNTDWLLEQQWHRRNFFGQ